MPGSMLIVERGNVRIERWWNLSFEPSDEKASAARPEIVEAVRSVEDAVRSHPMSDVPLGVFLPEASTRRRSSRACGSSTPER